MAHTTNPIAGLCHWRKAATLALIAGEAFCWIADRTEATIEPMALV